jgi:hypothetical protein
MVRALLEGRKTQTRRVVKPQPELLPVKGRRKNAWAAKLKDGTYQDVECDGLGAFLGTCPYGQPGDRLWLREAWATVNPEWRPGTRSKRPFVNYRATDEIGPHLKWCSPLFMPRWASRLTLELTDVRVQRLQDISEEDATAEGALEPREASATYTDNIPSARRAFRHLWESINGAGSWEANPWVWALTFKAVA